jgi:hypothetical protein
MKSIIADNEAVKIPHDRIILDGMGYSTGVRSIRIEWDGLLGYHVYPFFIKEEQKQHESNYSNLVQDSLADVAPRTFVTEFGADLSRLGDANQGDENVEFMKGMFDAFHVTRPKGTFLFHGWDKRGDARASHRRSRRSSVAIAVLRSRARRSRRRCRPDRGR